MTRASPAFLLLLAALFTISAVLADIGVRARIITGAAEVIDGDSLRVNGRPIRLYAIDAPESNQRCTDRQGRAYGCGLLAAAALEAEIAGARVACVTIATDVYGRKVATCTARGRDLGEAMVAGGMAIEFVRYSDGRYAAAEREARAAKRGIHAGGFIEPGQWRRENRR